MFAVAILLACCNAFSYDMDGTDWLSFDENEKGFFAMGVCYALFTLPLSDWVDADTFGRTVLFPAPSEGGINPVWLMEALDKFYGFRLNRPIKLMWALYEILLEESDPHKITGDN